MLIDLPLLCTSLQVLLPSASSRADNMPGGGRDATVAVRTLVHGEQSNSIEYPVASFKNWSW